MRLSERETQELVDKIAKKVVDELKKEWEKPDVSTVRKGPVDIFDDDGKLIGKCFAVG